MISETNMLYLELENDPLELEPSRVYLQQSICPCKKKLSTKQRSIYSTIITTNPQHIANQINALSSHFQLCQIEQK
jgi:hypothetical protein